MALDFAGRLIADNMRAVADVVEYVPDWATGIEEIMVLALSNGDALGASVAFMIIEGTGIKDSPQQIIIGGHGGENVILANEGCRPTPLHDMGIALNPGGDYTISFQTLGDTQDEFGCSVELIFTSNGVREAKQWVARGVITAAVNANVEAENLNAVAVTLSSAGSSKIGGVIGCAAGDMAALGVNHVVALLSGGCQPDQECLLGGVGGELIVGSGAHIEPSQRIVNYPIPSVKKNVIIMIRGTIEAGVIMGGLSIGFVQ